MRAHPPDGQRGWRRPERATDHPLREGHDIPADQAHGRLTPGTPRSAAAYRRAGDLLRYPAGRPTAGGAAGRPAGQNAHAGPGVSAYGSAVNFEVSPLSGLLHPVPGPAPSGRWTDAGLLVPDLSDTAARFGLVPTGARTAWFDEYVKQYLTTADYMGVAQAAGLQADPASLIPGLLLLHPREVYLAVLTALNHAAHYPELADVYRDRFLARLNDVMADSVRRALNGTVDGVPRALLARQPVLRAMRTVLTYRRRPEGAPSAGDMSKLAPGLDPELAGMLPGPQSSRARPSRWPPPSMVWMMRGLAGPSSICGAGSSRAHRLRFPAGADGRAPAQRAPGRCGPGAPGPATDGGRIMARCRHGDGGRAGQISQRRSSGGIAGLPAGQVRRGW